MGALIYAIDDEQDILDILKINLESEGYATRCFLSAMEALRSLEKAVPDLIILDIMMPGMDGFEFCRRVRSSEAWRAVPIIFLSAKSEEFDRVLGLELGGDDFVPKPFSVKELISRVKAVLRRTSAIPAYPRHEITIEGIALNPDHYQVTVDGRNVDVTKTEFEILRLFMQNPGKIFTRDNIIDSIKGQDVYVIDRTVDVHIMNLRKKLGPYKSLIRTFSGVGYGIKK